MDKRGQTKVGLGYLEIPIEYPNYTFEEKNMVCDRIISSMLVHIDRELPKELSRLEFLEHLLQSTLESNEEEENYEICNVIIDCVKRLNE